MACEILALFDDSGQAAVACKWSGTVEVAKVWQQMHKLFQIGDMKILLQWKGGVSDSEMVDWIDLPFKLLID